MRRVRILEEAAEEASEAAAWYEQECTGLGMEFAQAVEAAIDLLEDEVVPLRSCIKTLEGSCRPVIIGVTDNDETRPAR